MKLSTLVQISDVCCSIHNNAIEGGMNSSVLSLAIGK